MSEVEMDYHELFEAVVGFEPIDHGYARIRLERRTFRRYLDIGSVYAAMQARGTTPTAKRLYIALGEKYDLNVVEAYLRSNQQCFYLAALQREPSIFRLGLECLEAMEPGHRAEAEMVAEQREDLARVYRGDPRGRGGQV